MSNDTLPSPRLPIEVIEQVIGSVSGLLYEGANYGDLRMIWRACALTCRAMLPRSQFWLFRDIWLQSEVQALSFTEVLRKNAAVAPHIRILRLCGPDEDEDGRGYTWISWVPLVFAPLMKNLRELELRDDAFRDCHPGLPQALTAFKSIRKLSLFGVAFSSFGHCIRLIRAFPHLRHIDFIYVLWKPDLPDSQPWPGHRRNHKWHQRKRVQLAHLDLGGDDPTVHRLSKYLLNTGATKSLVTFYRYPEQHDFSQEIAFLTGSSIRSMVLIGASDFSIQISEGSLNTLQTMHLRMVNDMFPTRIMTSIVVAASRQLRGLTIYLRAGLEEISDELALAVEETNVYTLLDAALCKPVLGGLTMTVCLYAQGASIEAVDQWQRKLVTRLPKFCSHEGRLVVKSVPVEYPLDRWRIERDGFSLID